MQIYIFSRIPTVYQHTFSRILTPIHYIFSRILASRSTLPYPHSLALHANIAYICQ